jgi:hypothetical protein
LLLNIPADPQATAFGWVTQQVVIKQSAPSSVMLDDYIARLLLIIILDDTMRLHFIVQKIDDLGRARGSEVPIMPVLIR